MLARLEAAGSSGEVLVESRDGRRTRRTPTRWCDTPIIVALTAGDREVYEAECFGPVAYLIATAGTDESIDAVPRRPCRSTGR